MTDHTALLRKILTAIDPGPDNIGIALRISQLADLRQEITAALDAPRPVTHSILTYADVSTSHITQNDMELLAVASVIPLPTAPLVCTYPSGAFLYSSEFPLDRRALRGAGYSGSFIQVLRYARDNDCTLVRLDADGAIIEGLDHHEW